MRYSVVSLGKDIQSIVELCIKYGGTDIKSLPAAKQVFCDMDTNKAMELDALDGIVVKEVKRTRGLGIRAQKITPKQVVGFREIELYLPEAEYNENNRSDVNNGNNRNNYNQALPLLTQVQQPTQLVNMAETFGDLLASFSPVLTGAGLTVAILDTGIRDTHKSLIGKVVSSFNCTTSPDASDVFGHGTQIAHIIAGLDGIHGGVAPGAMVMNIKVLDDNGDGTEEEAVEGISHVCELVRAAIAAGKDPTDPEYPNTINISAGTEDENDPYSPIRVACKAAKEDFGLQVIAAAGNEGPGASTILSPACDENVIAIGGLQSFVFDIWNQSSRGPTLEGLVKPDMVIWSENIEGADSESDDGYVVKSGSSFSTPIISGVHGLMWEITRRIYGQQQQLSWYDILAYGSLYFAKPPGVSLVKDNSYGWGAPAISAVINKITGIQTGSTMSNVVMGMMMVGMMGIMIKVVK